MKRVLIFSLAYQPHMSGAEWAVKYVTDRISREDIAFDMITLRFERTAPDVETIGNVRVYRVKGLERLGYLAKVFFPLLAAVGAWRLHRRNRYDAFWALMSYMLFPIVLLRLQGRGIRVPYTVTLQDGDPFEHVFSRPRIAASAVHVISSFLAEWPRRFGYKGDVEIIPNGVDMSHFAGEKIPHETPTLITTSRLVRKNGIDTVIRALPSLPGVRFVVLGLGDQERTLKSLAQELGVAERVEFVGLVDNENVPSYLHHADVFVRPSRSEGLGTSFIEAMAAGLPVVATQEGGIKDFLFDAKGNPGKEPTGWAVGKDSPEQIAQAVKEILDNPEAAQRVIGNAKRMVRERYDWDVVAKDMRERVFGRILN
jgi:glycosyltransferase involved in cell wall biosynthesis